MTIRENTRWSIGTYSAWLIARRRLDESPVHGLVRLDMSDDIASAGSYPALLAEFGRQQPDIQMGVTVGSGAKLQQALECGEVDHLLCKISGDFPADAIVLWREQLYCPHSAP